MPLGGENVGTAYVRILADGTGLDESIGDSMDDIDWDSMGRKGSQQWQEGFEKEQAKAPNQRRLRDAVSAPLVRGKWLSTDFFHGNNWQNFRISMEKEFGQAGRIAANSLEEDLLNGLDFDGLNAKLKDITPTLVAARKQMAKELEEVAVKERQDQDKQWEIHIANLARLDQERLDSLQDTLNEAYRMNRDFDKKIRATTAGQRAAVRELRGEYQSLIFTLQRVERGQDSLARGTRTRLKREIDAMAEAMRNLGVDTEITNKELDDHRLRLLSTHPALRRSIILTGRTSDAIGRLFGKGSRSEFLNFFGRIVGGFAGLFTLPLKGVEKLIGVWAGFQKAFTDGGILGVLQKATGGLVGLAAGAAGLSVILGGVVVIVGVLSSALLSLAGAAVAMASSLAFALGGAAVVALGALTPLIAAIGVGILAFKNMDKQTKKAFDGIGKSFKKLGEDAAQNIFDTPKEDAEALKTTIESLEKITGPVSKALGGLLDEFIDSLNDPLIKNFVSFLGKVLPGMVTSLGHIFGNLGEAFIGVFRAISPFVRKFLEDLGQLTQRFADWANSPEGKHEIRDFMRDAAESATAVKDALGQVIGLIGDLFEVSKGTGDNLFTSLADEVERWRTSLEEASKNGTLKQWFTDAGETAKKIGTMVTELGKFIEKLDTPENRKLVRDIADAFVLTVEAIAAAAPVLEAIFLTFAAPLVNIVKQLANIEEGWKQMVNAMRVVYNATLGPLLGLFLDAIGGILEKLGDMFDILDSLPGAPSWIGKTADALHNAADETRGLADEIRNIPDANIDIVGPSPATINKIEAQLGFLARDRTATIHANLTGYPGPSTGGQDPTNPRTIATTPINTTPVHYGNTPGGKDEPLPANKQINANGWVIQTPTKDPEAVAAEVINRLAATGY